jgi:hypothetical protein
VHRPASHRRLPRHGAPRCVEEIDVSEQVNLSCGHRPIDFKWVFKVEAERDRLESVAHAARVGWSQRRRQLNVLEQGAPRGKVYVSQSPGFAVVEEENKVLRLRKAARQHAQLPRLPTKPARGAGIYGRVATELGHSSASIIWSSRARGATLQGWDKKLNLR